MLSAEHNYDTKELETYSLEGIWSCYGWIHGCGLLVGSNRGWLEAFAEL